MICNTCSIDKPKSEFPRHNGRIFYRCKECAAIYAKQWREKNKEYSKQLQRAWHERNVERLKEYGKEYYEANKEHRRFISRKAYYEREYGISYEEYCKLVNEQDGRCKICGAMPSNNFAKRDFLVVDHNHRTGTIRGLLCQKCNRGIGQFSDSIILLTKAIAYLDEYRTKWESGKEIVFKFRA